MLDEGRYSIGCRKVSAVCCICTPWRSYTYTSGRVGSWDDVNDRRHSMDRANNAHVMTQHGPPQRRIAADVVSSSAASAAKTALY